MYIVQFAIARIVSPGEFGVVRTVESAFSMALVVASAGLPSLAIKSIATMQTLRLQGRLLRRLVGLVISTSLLTAVVVALAARYITTPAATHWLAAFIFALVPVTIARTCTNFFQGLGSVRRISMIVAVGSAIGVLTVVVSSLVTGSLGGWWGVICPSRCSPRSRC